MKHGRELNWKYGRHILVKIRAVVHFKASCVSLKWSSPFKLAPEAFWLKLKPKSPLLPVGLTSMKGSVSSVLMCKTAVCTHSENFCLDVYFSLKDKWWMPGNCSSHLFQYHTAFFSTSASCIFQPSLHYLSLDDLLNATLYLQFFSLFALIVKSSVVEDGSVFKKHDEFEGKSKKYIFVLF